MKGSMKKQVCNIYRGSFVQGRREGFGTFFYLNGSQYTGSWVNNIKEGNGLYIYPDGKIFSGGPTIVLILDIINNDYVVCMYVCMYLLYPPELKSYRAIQLY